MHVAGKTAFVTGASRGIGRAVALASRAEGAGVLGTKTATGKTDDACDEWIVADFTLEPEIESCADRLRTISADVLVNNAGINKVAPFVDIDRASVSRFSACLYRLTTPFGPILAAPSTHWATRRPGYATRSA